MGASKIINPQNFHPDELAMAAEIFDTIAEMSADIEGVNRPAFSEKETEILDYLHRFSLSAGLAASYDAGQNLVVSLPQDEDAKPYSLIGSHVDSVPRGGNFDGLAGVVGGLLCLLRARREAASFQTSLKVIAMRGEESARFGPCYIGSKALLGVLTAQELDARNLANGQTLETHMAQIGIDTERVRAGKPLMERADLLQYLEMHIEQGPVLVEQNIPVAIVTGIRGNFRYKRITCIGESGHSGAVPRAYRHDPVLAMAELMNHIDESWKTLCDNGSDLVVTSGVVSTNQATHALSRIPESVEFSLDVRSQSKDTLKQFHTLMMKEIAAIEATRQVRFDLGDILWTQPALCAPKLVTDMTRAAREAQIPFLTMPSGGGHDAAVFADQGVPTGMIFIRNRNGSHNPQEAMAITDLMLAVDLAYRYLRQPAQIELNDLILKGKASMFRQIIKVIPEHGYSVDGFRMLEKNALKQAAENTTNAMGYFLLAIEAGKWAAEHYEQALIGSEGEEEYSRLEAFAEALDTAYASQNPEITLKAVSQIAQEMAST